MAEIDLLTDLPDATITAYYRASDVTLNGSDVSQLDDLSGGAKHFVQATAGNQPVYNATNASFNNKPTIDPVSASNEFMRASTLDLGTTFTVVVIGAKGGASEAWLSEDNTADDGYVGFDASSQPIIDNGATLTSANAADTSPAIFEYRCNGTTSLIRDKAVEGNTGTLGTANNWDDIYLFRRQDGTLEADVVFAEMLIVSGSLTQADRRIIHQYANQYYAMAMPFPQTIAPVSTDFTSFSTNHNANVASDVEENDGLLLVGHLTVSPNTPSGWTDLGGGSGGGGQLRVYFKLADGTEGGGTVNITTDSTSIGHAVCVRWRDWHGGAGGVLLSDGATGNDAAPDPPDLTVPWGALRALWFAVAATDNLCSAVPAGYSNEVLATGATNVHVNLASKESAAASENPGTFTQSGINGWRAHTLGIRPITAESIGGAGILAAGL